eukprot:CAMPEP_0118644240 /NCGR_PEP_ID=MMETSP0785-20121206/6832_1 /TAXON_ID=91992 /ORGANISM="Bolidomonas pacifica, Strain CCMP 1866" /LENGTH=119 /DNA_ID=CAMNT_0006535983 /DNA_START=66 /DNA_END=425 /DNA_ORIENTATION=+
MDALSAEQKQEIATSMAALALYDGDAEISSENIKTLLDAAGVEVEGFYPIIFSQFLTAEKITELISNPPGSGGGGGGGGGAEGGGDAEEAKEEEKVEEEEMDMGGAMDMFGGDAGDGDY